MLPHKVFQEEQFNIKVDELKNRFNKSAEDNVFPKGENKNLPLDGLQIFIDQTWDVIRNQKELNLPDQRQMVANFRCTEIKGEAIEKVQADINALRLESEKSIIGNFQERCAKIVQTAGSHFESNANQYSGVVFSKVMKELMAQLYQTLYICFASQLKLIRQKVFDEFDIKIRNINKKDAVNDQFTQQTNQMLKKVLTDFEKHSREIVVENSGWEDQVQQDTHELENQLLSVIKSQRERELDKMHTITTKATFQTIEEIVSPPIYELNQDFWTDIRDPYISEMFQVLLNCK